MYLYQRSPYKYNKKYWAMHSKSKSIQKIITARLDDLKLLHGPDRGSKENKVVSESDYEREKDYSAFGLSRRDNVNRKKMGLEIKFVKANFNTSQGTIKQNFKQELDFSVKQSRNRVKLMPLKEKNAGNGSCFQSPVEGYEALKPKFIF